MLGHCPNCDKEILRIKGQKSKPLGNYRSIKFALNDGSTMEMGVCLDCHDAWDDKMTDEFMKSKMEKFLRKVYEQDGKERSDQVVDYYKKKVIVGVARKMGALKRSETINPRIWK